MTKQELERARLAGITARQGGRKRETCPLYGMGRDGELWREAWQDGWDEEDGRREK